jgi:hypothetical protein
MKNLLFFLFLYNAVYSQGIHGQIRDSETKKALPARIVITDDTGHVYNSYYSKLKGFFTEEDGSFFQELKEGKYTLEVFRGIDYLSQKISFEITNRTVDTTLYLKPWYKLKMQGWYNGDGHDHLYTELTPDTAMMRLVRKICLAQGVDFMCTAQGWSGYNDSTWKEGYRKFSDDNFTVSFGSEMPKYRTGHTWWLGQKSTRGIFESLMDTTYENQYYQSGQGTSWNFETLPFPQVPDVEIVNRLKHDDGALAIAAHPTSWWMQERGKIEKYVTNVACNLSFGLLSGKIWDGIVAMGYDHDHYYYQNLWFNILNKGYRMPAFSELDGGLGKDDKFYYGSMRTYFHVDGTFSIDKMVESARAGRSFLTSGPIVMANIDSRFEIGDVVPAGNKKHILKISAHASGEGDDYLSYVVVFRNGKIFKLWDVRQDKRRTFDASLPIIEKERSWYIVKVYGRHAWQDPGSLDVIAVCEGRQKTEPINGEQDVAFTNPFYFRQEGQKDIEPLHSKVELTLSDSSNNSATIKGTIELLLAGKKIKTISVTHNNVSFEMPVNALLKIHIDGYPVLYRNLYVDYLPHRNLIEELSSGRWREKYASRKFVPGEVPWEAFNFDETKKILSDVKWTIPLKQNERDLLY